MEFASIDVIKDLLTGSTWDKFKEMIEPYALVSAIVFMALNLALVYPALGSLTGNPLLAALVGASAVWKLTIATIILFVLSYLINHLSTFFLDFASGEIFRDSPIIGKQLNKWQEDQFNKLMGDATEDDDNVRNKAAFHLAYEFPVKKDELGLTRLGNLLINPPSYTAHQYGASMKLAWPIIHEKLGDDDKTVKAIQGNWIALAFFTTLYGLLLLIGIELICLPVLGGKNMDVWQIAMLLVFAAICYYAAVEEARQWAGGMRRVFDSHGKEVFIDLGMDALKDLTPASREFNSIWQEVLTWLAYGALRDGELSKFGAIGKDDFKPQQKWYKIEPKPAPVAWPQLKHPEFLRVEAIMPPFTSQEPFYKEEGGAYICIEKTVGYLFAITNISVGENPLSGKDAYILVQDDGVTPEETVNGQLTRLKESNTSPEITVQGKRQPGTPAGVLFPLGNIPPGSSRVLKYSVDSILAKATFGLKIKSMELLRSKTESFVELFIDIFLEEATENGVNMSLRIEMQDDAQTTLIKRAELCAPPLSTYEEGKMSDDKRVGVWSLKLAPGIQKIRIRLTRTHRGG